MKVYGRFTVLGYSCPSLYPYGMSLLSCSILKPKTSTRKMAVVAQKSAEGDYSSQGKSHGDGQRQRRRARAVHIINLEQIGIRAGGASGEELLKHGAVGAVGGGDDTRARVANVKDLGCGLRQRPGRAEEGGGGCRAYSVELGELVRSERRQGVKRVRVAAFKGKAGGGDEGGEDAGGEGR